VEEETAVAVVTDRTLIKVERITEPLEVLEMLEELY
jgi:hypothetical protein